MDGVARRTPSYATNTQTTPSRPNIEGRTPLLNGQVADTSSMNWLVTSHDPQLGACIHKEITEGRLQPQQASADQSNYHIALTRADGTRALALLNFHSVPGSSDLHLAAVKFGENMVWLRPRNSAAVNVQHPAKGAAPGALMWYLHQQMRVNQAAAQSLRHDHPLKQQLEEKSEVYRQRFSATASVQQKIQRLLRLQSQSGTQLNQPGASRQGIGQQLQIIDQQLKAETINFQVAFANLSHRPVNDQDRAPFRELELLHAELFRGGPIECVPEGSNVSVSNVRDVDMDEFDVINSKDGCQGIGTSGLGPCIAVCARGMDKEGLPVLGIYHHSGMGSPEETMATLDQAMRDKGALHIKYSLVGGRIMPKEEEAGSYADEQSFLALKGSYSIEGARLHVSEGEEDAHTGEDNSVNVLLMPNRVLYGRDTLYR
jgi:hypothetical protein